MGTKDEELSPLASFLNDLADAEYIGDDECADCGGSRANHGGMVGCVRFQEPGTPMVNPLGKTQAERFGYK